MTLIGVEGNPDKIHNKVDNKVVFFDKDKLVLYNIEYIPDKFYDTKPMVKNVDNFFCVSGCR